MFDEQGQVVLDKTTPHRFSALGPDCVCGLGRYTAVHFNGDAELALTAKTQAALDSANRRIWEGRLKVGSRVQVSEDHPRDELVGRTGTIRQITKSGGNSELSAVIEFTGPVDSTLNIPVRYLQEIQIRTEVPEFESQDQADKWMADRAKELGIVERKRRKRRVPIFDSQEEADEWMRKQAGEAYVPPSWRSTEELLDGTIRTYGDAATG